LVSRPRLARAPRRTRGYPHRSLRWTVRTWSSGGSGSTRGTPASTAASATVARIVSMLTVTPADASSRTTGKTRASSVAADTRFAEVLSTSTLQRVKSILRRAIARAQARDRVRRNVVLLCDTPIGKGGRPSKSLTMSQAQAVLVAAEASPLRAYLVVALLTGARTEELRALTWLHVVLDGDAEANPPTLPRWACRRCVWGPSLWGRAVVQARWGGSRRWRGWRPGT
jgi:integrase